MLSIILLHAHYLLSPLLPTGAPEEEVEEEWEDSWLPLIFGRDSTRKRSSMR